LSWSAAHVAYSLIRPKSQIPNIRHDGTLSFGNFMLMMKKPKDLEFEPVHPKNVLLASVVHGISCLFVIFFLRFFYLESNKIHNQHRRKAVQSINIWRLSASKCIAMSFVKKNLNTISISNPLFIEIF
jgi:predicted membrane channel-forming protein YqfA (hemolysin III family)